MGTTRYGIPYPENTDRVADGATAMRNLANRADALMGQPARSTSQVAGRFYTQNGTANTWNDFPEQTWAPTTFIAPPNGRVLISAMCEMRSPTLANNASLRLAYRLTPTVALPFFRLGPAVYAAGFHIQAGISSYASLTAATTYTITPTWQSSDPGGTTEQAGYIANGVISVTSLTTN